MADRNCMAGLFTVYWSSRIDRLSAYACLSQVHLITNHTRSILTYCWLNLASPIMIVGNKHRSSYAPGSPGTEQVDPVDPSFQPSHQASHRRHLLWRGVWRFLANTSQPQIHWWMVDEHGYFLRNRRGNIHFTLVERFSFPESSCKGFLPNSGRQSSSSSSSSLSSSSLHSSTHL